MVEKNSFTTEASGVYRVKRWRGGMGAGHWGTFSCERLDEPTPEVTCDPYVPSIIGRQLADGTVLEVTVRVITEKPFTKAGVNPWHYPLEKTSHSFGHYGPNSTTGEPNSPWGCAECHASKGCCGV